MKALERVLWLGWEAASCGLLFCLVLMTYQCVVDVLKSMVEVGCAILHGFRGSRREVNWRVLGCEERKEKKALVLDLDETLVHSRLDSGEGYAMMLRMRVDGGRSMSMGVQLRPHVDLFLRMVAEWYDVYIFTSAAKEYADPVIDLIDRYGAVKGRFYRDRCIKTTDGYVKDLTDIRKDLSQVIIVDNFPQSYAMNADNAIPIRTWTGDTNDDELLNLLPLLHALSTLHDVRSLLALRQSFGHLATNIKTNVRQN